MNQKPITRGFAIGLALMQVVIVLAGFLIWQDLRERAQAKEQISNEQINARMRVMKQQDDDYIQSQTR